MNAIRTYLKKSSDIESKIPAKMPNENPTRSWCGYSDFFTAFLKSFDRLQEIIPGHLDMPSDKNFVQKISFCLQDFSEIFKKLEVANKPTIHLVLKLYKEMFSFMDKWPRQADEFKKPLKKCNYFFFITINNNFLASIVAFNSLITNSFNIILIKKIDLKEKYLDSVRDEPHSFNCTSPKLQKPQNT